MNLIQWIRPSLEGNDGKASGRSITAFWLTILLTLNIISIGYFVYYVANKKAQIIGTVIIPVDIAGLTLISNTLEFTLETLIGAVLLLWGVITAQQLISLKTLNPTPINNAPTVNVINPDTANVSNSPNTASQS